MSVLFTTNKEMYDANSDPAVRVFVNQGGTSSGKTYCIVQRLIQLSYDDAGSVTTIAGQDLPNLKVGAMRDMQNIIGGNKLLTREWSENKSDHIFRNKQTGSIIEFRSYENEQDAKSGKRDYLFVNEANGISWEVYWQLQIRTRKQVWIDYNPTTRFWAHDKLIGHDGVKLIISDHRFNHFLSASDHLRIESIADPELFKVYARGRTGKLSGLIIRDWQTCDALPPLSECKMRCFGLDFGFTNDPTALEEVRLAHGELWVHEHIYETGLTNPAIADRAKRAGVTGRDLIIADCAEAKSIAELRNAGMWVVPSTKGVDSVKVGLDILRRYKLHITSSSRGILDEVRRYRWKKDKDGNDTNVPIDAYNHAIDAIRYVALAKLAVNNRGGGGRPHVIEA